jgi:acetyltransferase
MSRSHLERMFQPATVAVVGASEGKGRIGTVLMENLLRGGFRGTILPVNPRHREVFGLRCFASVAQLAPPVDLALIAVPMPQVPGVVGACAAAGVGAAVIFSSGGREVGADGRAAEEAIRAALGELPLRLIGPNSLGLVSRPAGLNASASRSLPPEGRMAFLSQSGAIYAAILDLAARRGIGFSHVVCLGSMMDVTFAELIDHLGDDPQVRGILMYAENLSRFRTFMSAARAVSRVKPIIALKAGRTGPGRAAAAAHTGARAGDDRIYDAALRRAGIIRVRTFEELFDAAALVGREIRSQGTNLAIVTNAGGPGVMAVDALADRGTAPAALRPETLESLKDVLPEPGIPGNPVKVPADASAEIYRQVVQICLGAEEVQGVLVILTPHVLNAPTEVAATLAAHFQRSPRPLFASWLGGPDVQEGRDILAHAGVAVFDTPERAVRAFMNLHRHHRNLELLQEIPSRLPRRLDLDRAAAAARITDALRLPYGRDVLLSGSAARQLLSCYAIPMHPAQSLAAAHPAAIREAAAACGYPVLLKRIRVQPEGPPRVLRRVLHGEAEVASIPKAWFEGTSPGTQDEVLLERLILPEFELLAGVETDPDFGPAVRFGLGGASADLIGDQAFTLPPLNRLLARRLMEETRVYQRIASLSGQASAIHLQTEEILVRLSQLVTDFAEVQSVRLNPLIVQGGRVVGGEAWVRLAAPARPAPLHLVISAYPDELEAQARARDGRPIFIRPIRPEDASLMVTLFESLSSRSVYRRFFSPMKNLPRNMLARFTQIDYDREIALIALDAAAAEEVMLGVARVITARGGREAEFSVLVGDPWQGLGIGAELLLRCLRIAKARGMERVWGLVLTENTQMLALGKKLGFQVRRVPEAGEYELQIDLGCLDA